MRARAILTACRGGAIGTALLALGSGCGNARRPAATHVPALQAHVASSSCPLKTPDDWRRFLGTAVDDETWVKTCSAEGNCGDLLGAFSSHVQRDVLDVFDHCADDVANNPRIALCTARLRRFVPEWQRQHASGSYGFVQDNHAYLAGQTASDTPRGMMDPPVDFVEALPERAKIEEAARTNGWPFVTHDSCFGGVRTFIVVSDPAKRFDQWFLVRFDSDSARVPENSVMSFIAVQKKDAAGSDLERIRLHFRDYIAWKGERSWQLALPEVHEGKCYACHGSGMRLLVPTHESIVASAPVKGEPGYPDARVPADFGFHRLSEFNERLASYGLPDWNGSVDPGAHGPALGASLGCTTCHDGVDRGVLSVSTDVGTFEHKMAGELSMQSFAAGKQVPDKSAMALLDRERTRAPALAPKEMEALDRARREHLADYRTFMAERFPVWRAWMLEERCE